MTDRTIPYDEFQDGLRNAVLAALDDYAGRFGGVEGWIDAELGSLFTGVDAHARTLAARINGTKEGGAIITP